VTTEQSRSRVSGSENTSQVGTRNSSSSSVLGIRFRCSAMIMNRPPSSFLTLVMGGLECQMASKASPSRGEGMLLSTGRYRAAGVASRRSRCSLSELTHCPRFVSPRWVGKGALAPCPPLFSGAAGGHASAFALRATADKALCPPCTSPAMLRLVMANRLDQTGRWSLPDDTSWPRLELRDLYETNSLSPEE
jgi:hypothetical protein